MKKLFLVTIAFMIGISVSAQKIFFPTKKGTKLYYQMYDKKGKTSNKTIYTIKEVKGSGDNLDVTYQVDMLDDKDKTLYSDEVAIHQKGDKMYCDMSNFLNKAAFPQQEGEKPTLEITGNNLEIPLIPIPGMSLPDAFVSMSMKVGFLNLKMTANVTNRKVDALESVTVEGGTFNAFKISSTVNSSILGIKVNTSGTDWYVYNIGIVKTVSLDKKGNMASSLELIKIEE
jgi:hypothetical protein